MNPDHPLIKSHTLEQERNKLANERTLLASERTFLSWLRTGLTSIGIGIAIARLLIFNNPQKEYIADLIGQLLIVWGIIIFIFSLISYRRSYKKLNPSINNFYALTGLTFLTSLLILLSCVLFWIIV